MEARGVLVAALLVGLAAVAFATWFVVSWQPGGGGDEVARWRLRMVWRVLSGAFLLACIAGVAALAVALVRADTWVERAMPADGILWLIAIGLPVGMLARGTDLRITTHALELPGITIPWADVEEAWFDGAVVWIRIPTRRAYWNGWSGTLRIARASYAFSGEDYQRLRQRLPDVTPKLREWSPGAGTRRSAMEK